MTEVCRLIVARAVNAGAIGGLDHVKSLYGGRCFFAGTPLVQGAGQDFPIHLPAPFSELVLVKA